MQIHQQLSGSKYGGPNRYSLASEEFDEFQGRGRQPEMVVSHPVYKKQLSSPSKMFRQFQPNPASRSPYRQSETHTNSSYKPEPAVQISPLKKYCTKETNSIQNVHNRLREYQGSQGKTSVSKALFKET